MLNGEGCRSLASKRIVIWELSGLWRIVGIEPEVEGYIRPEFVPEGEPLSLIRVEPRYVLYKEIRILNPGKFNETFHPNQV